MLQWQLTTFRSVLPIIVVVQILFGVGFAVGMGLFFPTMTGRSPPTWPRGSHGDPPHRWDSPRPATRRIGEGGRNIRLHLVAAHPRSATTAAWVVINAIFALPGAIAALLVAAWRYQIQYDASWMVIPAMGLT